MKKRIILMLSMAVLLASCGGSEPDPVEPEKPQESNYIHLGSTTKEVGNGSGSFSLKVQANCDWTASSGASWLTLSKSASTGTETITLNYEANSKSSSRTGTVSFSASGVKSVDFTVTQTGRSLKVSKSEQIIDNIGGSFELEITANCPWTVSSDAFWMGPSTSSGEGSATLKIDCGNNPDGSIRRQGVITIAAEGLSPLTVSVTQGRTFENPIGGIPDPYIVKDGNSYYLCKAATGINISKSTRLSSLTGTKEVWRPDINSTTDWNTSHIWAPELHKIGGKWYVYYAAGRPSSESGGSYKLQRSGVLRAKTDDPEGAWEDMGMLYTGDNYVKDIKATAANTSYAIDLTVFELRGQLYAVWSGAAGKDDSNQSIFIATMSDPCTISCSRVRLSSAESSWETKSSQIQEGPAILRHGGKIFIVYSCNGSWTKYYRLGYLMMDESSDPLKPDSWKKSPASIFYRCDDTSGVDGVNGVGHCTFTTSPDGTEDWIVYHAKNRNDNTYTTGRSTYLKKFTWKSDGTPDLGTPSGYKERYLVPSGE